ncbi:MAG TPA: tetratricopeptide repeat protein [Chitinophagaceae bacterium]|nr:tetratricopeptide repeat protein [Chitinophagaceae bacterium]
MRQMLNRVVKNVCTVDRLSSLSVEDLHNMQLEAPYVSIFTLLHTLHPSNRNTVKTKWEHINVHANNLLWWQYVALALEEADAEETIAVAESIIKDEVVRIDIETLEPETDQPIEEEVVMENIEEEVNTVKSIKTETPIVETSQTIEETTVIDTIEEEANTALSAALAKIKESLDAPLLKQNVFIDLEPYHTVDYFASQGIKIDAIIEPKDKLGKQLKSFTDWLKTMKRIGPTPANLSTDTESEKEIVHHAASSIAKDEIITETMAEVLAKQGKIDKAIEVYEQLRLINPDKNAYFAAKIKQLILN